MLIGWVSSNHLNISDDWDYMLDIPDSRLAVRFRILEDKIKTYQKQQNQFAKSIPENALKYCYFEHFRPTAHLSQHYKLTLKNEFNKYKLRDTTFLQTAKFLWAYYQEILIQFLLDHRKPDAYAPHHLYYGSEIVTTNQNNTGQILPLTNTYLDKVQTYSTPDTIEQINTAGQDYMVICLNPDNLVIKEFIASKTTQFAQRLNYAQYNNKVALLTHKVWDLLQDTDDNGYVIQENLHPTYSRTVDMLYEKLKINEYYILSTYTLTHFFKPHKFLIP